MRSKYVDKFKDHLYKLIQGMRADYSLQCNLEKIIDSSMDELKEKLYKEIYRKHEIHLEKIYSEILKYGKDD